MAAVKDDDVTMNTGVMNLVGFLPVASGSNSGEDQDPLQANVGGNESGANFILHGTQDERSVIANALDPVQEANDEDESNDE